MIFFIGAIRRFVPAIKGFEQSMNTSVLAAYPLESMKVRVFDGSFTPLTRCYEF